MHILFLTCGQLKRNDKVPISFILDWNSGIGSNFSDDPGNGSRYLVEMKQLWQHMNSTGFRGAECQDFQIVGEAIKHFWLLIINWETHIN